MRHPRAPKAWAAPALFEVVPPQGSMVDATRREGRGLGGSPGPFPDPGDYQGYEKRFADLRGLYGDEAAFEALLAGLRDQVVYEVWEYRPSDLQGDLVFGTSRISAGRVGAEFFMTRGHRHCLTDSSEVYCCLAGRGVMLLELDGAARALAMAPGSIVYVPPHWIHRTVNVGAEPFVTTFCYAADAGHDYDVVTRAGGMRARVVVDEGEGWALVENPSWLRRELRSE